MASNSAFAPCLMASVRVALIQARPVYYDLAQTVAKALTLINEAARQGAQLAAFPETFFPGYPAWLDYAIDYARWDHAPTKQLYARLVANSMIIDGPEMRQLQDGAREQDITLALGINERVPGGRGNRSL